MTRAEDDTLTNPPAPFPEIPLALIRQHGVAAHRLWAVRLKGRA
jgi:hypothetical protein